MMEDCDHFVAFIILKNLQFSFSKFCLLSRILVLNMMEDCDYFVIFAIYITLRYNVEVSLK